MAFEGIGRLLIFLGLILALFGMVITFGGRILNIGRLPGDIVIRRGNFTFYFPLATSILISVALSLIGWFISRR